MRKLLYVGFIAILALAWNSTAFAGIPKPKTLWEIKAKKNVVRELVGDQGQYVWIRDDDEVKVFDGIKGGKLWEGKLKGFNEDGYYQLLNTDSPRPLYVYSLKKGLKCIEIATGKEVWETPLEIKTKKFLRSYSTDNGFLMEFDTDDQHYILLNLTDGKIIWEHSKSEGFTPYQKFVEKGIPVIWTFGERILMVMKKKVSLIDAKTGAELWKADKRWPSDAWGDNAIQEQEGKLLIFFEEGVGAVRLNDGKELWYREGEVEEANRSFVMETPEGKIGLFAFKDALICYKLDDGTILWEHKKDMPENERVIGNIEEVSSVPGDDRLKLFISFKSSLNPFKQKEMGGWITANGVEWKTGKVVYKTILIRGGSNPPSLFGLIKAYQRIRVTYYETLDESNGMITYLVKNTQPNQQVKPPKWGSYDHTKYNAEKNTGEGLIRFDPKTGTIVWRHYFDYLMDFNEVFNRIDAAGGDMGGMLEGASQMINAARSRKYTASYLTQPIVNSGKVFLCADRKMLCFDNATGNVDWETPEIGNATGLVELDNTFYVQIGRTFKSYKYSLSTSPGSCKAKETKIETKKPFGFLAIDKAKGNFVWDMTKEKEFKEDPTSYLMEYNAERKTMYCSDGKFVYAIPFTREGKIAWKHTLKELGVGSVKPEDGVVFIVKSSSSSMSSYYSGNGFGYTITKTVEYDIRKVLGVEYRKDKQGREFILGIGEDGLVRIDLDGKIVWKADKKVWDWDRDDVTFTPFYLPNGDICFGFNRRLTRIDVDKGSTISQVKEDKTATFDVHPTGKSLLAYTKKWIRSFDLTQAE